MGSLRSESVLSVRSAVVRAPAKVNLSLRVVAKRPDGYHELDSLMFAVSLYDLVAIRVEPARRASVACVVSGPERVAGGRDNLVSKAARAVLERLGTPARVSIRLRKEIPFGAGLGGGSSDAAAVLRVLPGLLGRRLARADLGALALGLGADVPFFLDCRPSRARGIGERLDPLARVPKGTLVIAVSPDRVDTAWAYRNALPRLTSPRSASSTRPLPRNIDDVEAWFFNDFQPGVEGAVESVRCARQALDALGARATVLSGSGCAVVGLFAGDSEARRAAEAYEGPGRAHVARILKAAPRPSSGD